MPYQLNEHVICTSLEQPYKVRITETPQETGEDLYRVQVLGSSFSWWCSEEFLRPIHPQNLPATLVIPLNALDYVALVATEKLAKDLAAIIDPDENRILNEQETALVREAAETLKAYLEPYTG